MKRRLGVNIDHVATLREARQVAYPDPVLVMPLLKEAAVDQVTLHLREDRRHIQDRDLHEIIKMHVLPVNLEMALTEEMLALAIKLKPANVTFVPEKREELTTEGGLDAIKNLKTLKRAVTALHDVGVRTSLFIDPDLQQVAATKETGALAIEIHTGAYCNLIEDFFNKEHHYNYKQQPAVAALVETEIKKIYAAAQNSHEAGIKVFAGHGLHKDNLDEIVKCELIEEYNIGHAIIARAIFVGMVQAVKEIQSVLANVR